MISLENLGGKGLGAWGRFGRLPGRFLSPALKHGSTVASSKSGYLRRAGRLSQKVMHDVSMDIRQSEISPLISVSQFAMIDAEQMKDRGVQIVDMHRAGGPAFFVGLGQNRFPVGIRDVVTVVIRATVGDPRFDSTTGHPDREASGMVVTTIVFGRQVSLAVNGSTEFSTPDNQRVFKETASLQVLDQAGTTLINVFSL